jgi:hypothetical protein
MRPLFYCFLLFFCAQVHAQWLIVSSNSPAFELGQRVSGVLHIPDDGRITLIANDGRVLYLSGPLQDYEIPGVQDSGTELVDTLATMLGGEEGNSRLAVYRQFLLPLPWTVQVDKAGSYCVTGHAKNSLLRQPPYRQSLLIVTNEKGIEQSYAWPAESSRMVWPAQLPDSGRQLLRLQLDRQAPVDIELVVVPARLPSDAHRVQWMAENGCESQAVLLLDQLR